MNNNEAWGIVPMYTEPFLRASGKEQSFAIACSRCDMVWDFGNMTEKKIIELAMEYGYKICNHVAVCDVCVAREQKERELEYEYQR